MNELVETDYKVLNPITKDIDSITLRECLLALGYIADDQEETAQIVNQLLIDLLSATKGTGSLFVFAQRFPNYEDMEQAVIRTASEDAADAKEEAIQRGLFL